LHTLNIVYIIKTMNIEYCEKIIIDFIQYTIKQSAFTTSEYIYKKMSKYTFNGNKGLHK